MLQERAALLVLATTLFAASPALGQLAPPAVSTQTASSSVRVIASYMERNTNRVVLESNVPLVEGRMVFAGSDAVPLVVGQMMSKTGDQYYYSASAPGKHDIKHGDEVKLEGPKALTVPQILNLKLNESYRFEQKARAEVAAVQGDRAMIDKGSIQEVHERDLYRVYTASGQYKGLWEARGVGDYQTQGKLYNALEDFGHRNALKTAPGDRVVFVGQRKLFALGLLGSVLSSGSQSKSVAGGGLVWNLTFVDGWGVEVLFGGFTRKEISSNGIEARNAGVLSWSYSRNREVKTSWYAPIWVKKNFFYPSVVSPFAAAGVAYFEGHNSYGSTFFDSATVNATVVSQNKGVSTIAPVLGLGAEFFSGRLFRPRLEIRYLHAPPMTAGGNTVRASALFYSLGFLTSW